MLPLTPDRTGWRAVLAPHSRERAKGAISELGEALTGRATERLEDYSLADGRAGIALFFRYLAAATGRPQHDEAADRFLDEAIKALAEAPPDASLYSGITGVAWVAAHIDPEEDAAAEVDEVLVEHLARSPWRGHYDLILGLAGLGVYGLERLPRPAARDCVIHVVDRLHEMAEWTAEGITWHTAPQLLSPLSRQACPDGHYNLGVAHGVPAVIAVLAGAVAAGIRETKARSLLDGAVSWLLAQRLPQGRRSRFPKWVAPGEDPVPSRTGWCYGDAGVAATLLAAARCVGEHEWEHEAVELALGAARRSPEDTAVLDPSLCHGAASLGHLFNRVFQATGAGELAEAARFWLERALDMRRPGEGVAGFSIWASDEQGSWRWVAEPGFIMGAAGIGLALIAGIGDVEPRWDRVLLVSPPGPTVP